MSSQNYSYVDHHAEFLSPVISTTSSENTDRSLNTTSGWFSYAGESWHSRMVSVHSTKWYENSSVGIIKFQSIHTWKLTISIAYLCKVPFKTLNEGVKFIKSEAPIGGAIHKGALYCFTRLLLEWQQHCQFSNKSWTTKLPGVVCYILDNILMKAVLQKLDQHNFILPYSGKFSKGFIFKNLVPFLKI